MTGKGPGFPNPLDTVPLDTVPLDTVPRLKASLKRDSAVHKELNGESLSNDFRFAQMAVLIK